VYSGSKELPVVRNGLGITIVLDARAPSRMPSPLAERRRRSAGGGVLMSRIGKKPVVVPAGVSANIADGVLSVKGSWHAHAEPARRNQLHG
jgi:hypothetical protein